jgi:excisionase family DNA binding protein
MELSIEEAAETLNVSTSYVVRLLEEQRIPFRGVGSDRRVRLADLLAYKEADDREREVVLDELSADAQKHGLG